MVSHSFQDEKTDVIANDAGDRTTPSVVAFTDHDQVTVISHSLILNFETVSDSKKLQITTEMWLLKDFQIQSAQKTYLAIPPFYTPEGSYYVITLSSIRPSVRPLAIS